MSGFRPGDMGIPCEKPLGDLNSSRHPEDLRDNNFTARPDREEAMDDVAADLFGLNNIAPNFKMDNKTKGNDDANQHGPDDANSSAMLPADIKKPEDLKKDSKAKNKKAKAAKKSKAKKAKTGAKSKKIKSSKKSKKAKKPSKKKSTKERAKL